MSNIFQMHKLTKQTKTDITTNVETVYLVYGQIMY